MSTARIGKKKPTSVEFKAGKATLADKRITADDRKGTLKMAIEFFSVPGELEFKKVEQCKDGRMYYLYFSSSDKKEFYWLQEPNPEGDVKIEETIKSIASSTDDEPTPIQPTPAPIQTPAPVTPAPVITQPAPVKAAATTSASNYPSTPSTSTSSPQVNMDLFKDFLSNYQPAGSILTPAGLAPILRDEEIRKQLEEYLPEGSRSSHDVQELLHTPQFAQAVDQLNHAVFDGHGGDIVAQLGFEPSMASLRGIEGFLTSIQDGVDKKKKSDAVQKTNTSDQQ
eukprot:gene10916-12721_t